MDSLEANIVKLLNAGFRLEIHSDGNTFTTALIDGDEKIEESNISLPRLIEGLVNLAALDSKCEIINAKQKLKFLDPENKQNWKEV